MYASFSLGPAEGDAQHYQHDLFLSRKCDSCGVASIWCLIEAFKQLENIFIGRFALTLVWPELPEHCLLAATAVPSYVDKIYLMLQYSRIKLVSFLWLLCLSLVACGLQVLQAILASSCLSLGPLNSLDNSN